MNYQKDIENEAVSFLIDFDEDFKRAIIDGKGFDRNEIDSLDSNFHESIVDRSYTAKDALFILENTENEETESGIWEGLDWEAQLSARAAYSFGNDVWFKTEEMYNEIKEKFTESKEEAESKDFDTSDQDIMDSIWSPYFNQFTPKEIPRDSPEELEYLKTWLRLVDDAGAWGSYPIGHAYIDARYGSGHGMPEIKNFVDHDNQAPYLVPYHVGKSRQDIKDRIAQIDERDGVTTIQLSRSTKRKLDSIKQEGDSYEDVILKIQKEINELRQTVQILRSKDVREI